METRKSRRVQVGENLFIGGDAPVVVQSMLNAPQGDIEANVQQARELSAAGCQLIRLSVTHHTDIDTIRALKEAVKVPLVADIQMNYEGLKDNVISMLAGGRCSVDPTGFQNDMSIIHSKNDVFTVLIHLGYLSYNWRKDECYIPNREVAGEMVNAVKATDWRNLADALDASKQLLQDTIDGDEEAVARGVDAAHDENTSILSYNNENSLACVLSIAYYYARNDYVMHRELATGKGFADIVLIPRKNVDSPAIVLELKFSQDADAAIDQIKRKQYPAKVSEHTANLLLVGINYDRETKQHTCHIERYQSE